MITIADRLKNLPPYLFMQLRDKIRQAEARGEDLISLAIGDPDEPTPAYIVESLRTAALDPANHQYPTDEHKGMLVFREAAARWYKRRYNLTINPQTEIMALNGVKEGIHHFIMALVNPGDIVLVMNPGYPAYRANALMAGAEAYDVPLLAKNNFLPDLDSIPEDVCKKAKAFFLNYPNNPTSVCADRAFFTKLVAWAKKWNILLLNDNPYSEIVFDKTQRLSLLEIPGAMDVCVELNSLSKAYNMTGWRIGMAVGSSEIVQAICKFTQNVASGVFNAIQLAAVTAMDQGDHDIENMLAIYRRRRELAVKAFSSMGITAFPGGGTFYLWLPVPQGLTSMEFASKMVDEAKVLVTPGVSYGQYGDGYFRVSLTIPDEQLKEGLGRMQKCLGR
jgi:LL-diaminopimelate aminotransferase